MIVCSDIERKRLAGLPWDARLPSENYTSEASARTYAELLRRAGVALNAGHAVILDAVSARPDVPLDVARERVSNRVGDASDAGAAVVERQRGYDLDDIAWPRIDTGRGEDKVVADARALLAAASIGG